MVNPNPDPVTGIFIFSVESEKHTSLSSFCLSVSLPSVYSAFFVFLTKKTKHRCAFYVRCMLQRAQCCCVTWKESLAGERGAIGLSVLQKWMVEGRGLGVRSTGV